VASGAVRAHSGAVNPTRLECVLDASDEGQTLAAVVRRRYDGLAWSRARALCEQGKVTLDGEAQLDAAVRVSGGMRLEVNPTGARRRRGMLDSAALVYVDADIVVVDKPAGVLAVPYQAGDKDTLLDLTQVALRRRRPDPQRSPLGAVQRLDKDTTGLMVFARHLRAKRALAAQLAERSVTRIYRALVHGKPRSQTSDTMFVANRGDGLRGSWGVYRRPRGGPPAQARRAITHVRVLERLRDVATGDAALVECALETGRQHQIRIHLSEAGHPLIGEHVYVRDYGGQRIDAPRIMLHAATLSFDHPRTGERVEYHSDLPADFQRLLAELRAQPAD